MQTKYITNHRTGVIFASLVLLVAGLIGVSLVNNSENTNAAPPAGQSYDLTEAGYATGLWKTGVNGSNQKLWGNEPDPHWNIDRVYRPGHDKDPNPAFTTYQRTFTDGSNPPLTTRLIPTSQPSIPARTVIEYDSNNIGLYTGYPNSTEVVGSPVGPHVKALIESRGQNVSPWKVSSPAARWISMNSYGQNWNATGEEDPTSSQIEPNVAVADVFVFKLSGGFNIDNLVDINSVTMKLSGYFDNDVQVFVNGKPVLSRPEGSGVFGQWTGTGFATDAKPVETQAKTGIFQKGNNTLELHVRSTYSHTGILISKLQLLGIEPVKPSEWRVEGNSAIKKTANYTTTTNDANWVQGNLIAKPGEALYFKHYLKAVNGSITNKTINYTVRGTGFLNFAPGGTTYLITGSKAPTTPRDSVFRIFSSAPGATSSPYLRYKVTQDDVGRNVCQSIAWNPTSWNNVVTTEASPRCASIPYDYTLTPTIGAVPVLATPDLPVTITPTVVNIGPTKTKPTQWEVTKFIVPRTVANIPNSGGGNSTQAPCNTYFKPAGVKCDTVAKGSSIFDERGSVLSGDPLQRLEVLIGDEPVGTRICFALSVKPRSSASTEWAHSVPRCMVVGKKPKVQVLGNDLLVGRPFSGSSTPGASNVQTSISAKKAPDSSTRVFGAWSEYGIFATGAVLRMGSASSYAGGNPDTAVCATAMLTFANTSNKSVCSSGSVLGGYKTNTSMPDVKSYFRTTTATPALGATSNLTSLSGLYRAPANITLDGGAIAAGKTIVINAPSSTVTITKDILYTTSKLTSTAQIPQVIIIAKDIRIQGSVKQIDAWLIASGSVTTCVDVAAMNQLTIDTCKDPLTVNGPVMAGKLYLWRTAGDEDAATAGNPAETFNLRPDAYLWGITQASKGGRLETVYERELPPRF